MAPDGLPKKGCFCIASLSASILYFLSASCFCCCHECKSLHLDSSLLFSISHVDRSMDEPHSSLASSSLSIVVSLPSHLEISSFPSLLAACCVVANIMHLQSLISGVASSRFTHYLPMDIGTVRVGILMMLHWKSIDGYILQVKHHHIVSCNSGSGGGNASDERHSFIQRLLYGIASYLSLSLADIIPSVKSQMVLPAIYPSIVTFLLSIIFV
jgi:hypothetical protein